MGPGACHPVLPGAPDWLRFTLPGALGATTARFPLGSKHLLNAYDVPGMALGTEEQNKRDPCPRVVHLLVRDMDNDLGLKAAKKIEPNGSLG